MWSSVTIPGKPSILVVDASRNLEGWEHDFTYQLFASFKRSGLDLVGEKPVRVQHAQQLTASITQNGNCILLFASGQAGNLAPEATMKGCWDRLQSNAVGPKVFAACMCQRYDETTSREVLKPQDTFAPIALIPQSTATPRESGLFLLKFFTELNLHSPENITGRMAWFSFTKATALLRKRRYTAKFGLRC